MSSANKWVLQELADLSDEARAELAAYLDSSLSPNDTAAVAQAWEREIERRMKEIEAGRVICIPAEEVFAKLRRRYP